MTQGLALIEQEEKIKLMDCKGQYVASDSYNESL